jgi:hypothetical protein
MIEWHQKRSPDDVPTPVAVAVADFCRRAKAPASPAAVRAALALLSEADDFRVKEVTDAEPAAKPLGPFALVDMVNGAEADLAAQRQTTGYYEVVQALVEERAKKAPPLPAPSVRSNEPAPLEFNAPAKPSRQKVKAERLADKIAPTKRVKAEVLEVPALPAPSALSALPKRDLPPPRGRFGTVDPSRSNIATLFEPEAKEEVIAFVEQGSNRVSLRTLLERGFAGRLGSALSLADVEAVVERHHLMGKLEKQERQSVVGAITEHKGALGRASHALGLRPKEFDELVEAAGLKREVVELRERYQREALALRELGHRLDLLGRNKYLQDLKIEKKFRDGLERDLKGLLAEDKGAHRSPDEFVVHLAKKHGVHAEALRRALETLKLVSTSSRRPRE